MEINVTVNEANPLIVSAEILNGCNVNIPVGQQPKQIEVTCDSEIAAIDIISTCALRKIDVTTFDPMAMNERLENHILSTSAHGTVSDIVGESDEQTLTNKTLDGGRY